VFHAFNRAIQGLVLFQGPADYDAFLRILKDVTDRIAVRLLAYVLMPTHWHFVLWPSEDGALSRFMHVLCSTHVQRWRLAKGSVGRGAVYQGRFKAVVVQTVCRYVERNPVRARLVERAEAWPWSSASPSAYAAGRPSLSPWPLEKPEDWLQLLNLPEPPTALRDVRAAIRRGLPFGTDDWRAATVKELGWRTGVRPRGRPRSRGGSHAEYRFCDRVASPTENRPGRFIARGGTDARCDPPAAGGRNTPPSGRRCCSAPPGR
jgi:putative transposase